MIHVLGLRPNSTPVSKHFHSAKPVVEQLTAVPRTKRRAGRRSILRLAFGALTPKEDRSIPELFSLINRGPLNSKWIFPDAGFITSPMHPRFWTLGRERRIGFSEMTIAELSGWFSFPMHNDYLHMWLPRAVTRCQAEPISEGGCYRVASVLGTVGSALAPFSIAIADKSSFKQFGYDYYVKLLSLRKKLGVVVARELRTSLGRDPTDEQLKQHLHNKYHPRIATIAFKGWKDQLKRNYLADEELVVTAALTAILSGTETLILTWDTDVFDQFAKLMELLAQDYICFRFSECHFHNPEGYPLFPLDISADSSDDFPFVGNSIKHAVFAYQDGEGLPPYAFTPVHAYCVLLGNHHLAPKISTAAFCLEAEMADLLRIKGATDGKNTARFPGQNIIAGSATGNRGFGTLMVLGEEKHVSYENVIVSWSDLQRALKSDPPVIRKRSLL
jgi:hypothetical protein